MEEGHPIRIFAAITQKRQWTLPYLNRHSGRSTAAVYVSL